MDEEKSPRPEVGSPEFTEALMRIFNSATEEARRKAHAAGVPYCGTDRDGNYVRVHPDGTREIIEPADQRPLKSR